MIAIIDYGAGNVASVRNSVMEIVQDVVLTDDIEVLNKADKIILPGVGEASFAMNNLKLRGLDKFIIETKKPLLGICLGLQLMCKYSEEGNTECLGIFPAKVLKFDSAMTKVPHMGWNTVEIQKPESKLFVDVDDSEYYYFANSFYAEICEFTAGKTTNIIDFSSILCRDNFYGAQFHPEKSSVKGNKIIRNFIELC